MNQGGGEGEISPGRKSYIGSTAQKIFKKEGRSLMAAADNQIADEIGASADAVESHRRETLSEGEHWVRENGRVTYTPAGKAAVMAALGGVADPNSIEKKEPPEPQPPQPVLLPIIYVPANPKIVVVKLTDGTRAHVRVRDNAKLRPNYLLRCMLTTNGVLCVQPGIAP